MLGHRDRNVRKAIERLLPQDGLVAVDIGARGDIPAHWLRLDGLATFISFDADPAACQRLNETYARRGHGDKYRVFPIALSSENSIRFMHVTNSGGGSSFFDVDVPIVRAYTDDDYLFPLRRIPIATRSADEVFRELGYEGFHLMKLDIQGGELEVLKSLGDDVLHSVLAVQLEAALQTKGVDYPTFVDVDTFMRKAGFDLYDVAPVHVHRSRNGRRSNYLEGLLGVDVHSPSIAGRVWEADALYLRAPEAVVPQRSGDTVRRLTVCFGLYGLFTEALHSLEISLEAGLLDNAEFVALTSAVLQWHRFSSYRWWRGLSLPARLIRMLTRRRGAEVVSVRGALAG